MVPVKWPEPDMEWHELKYNRLTLRYTLGYWGKQPVDGYPLYIGLHGGGSDTAGEYYGGNDAWNDMATAFYYLPTKAIATADNGKFGAAYISCRGVSSKVSDTDDTLKDEYNLHSRPESYVLFEQMIKNLLAERPQELGIRFQDYMGTLDSTAKHFVNSNKVYLVGHSAGGDGVFNLARGMPDLFAGVVASAGYACDANGSRAFFENFANLPLCLQVGERDDAYFQPDALKRSERAKFYYNYHAALNQLGKEYRPDGYPHECFIVKEGTHGDWLQKLTKDAQYDITFNTFTHLDDWYCDTTFSATASTATAANKMNAIGWANGKTRVTTPSTLVWNLGQRPPKIGKAYDNTLWEQKRFFYWLFDRKPSATATAGHTVRLRWDKTSDGNTNIYLDDLNDWMGILVREPMVQPGKQINIVWRWGTEHIAYTPNERIKQQTLEARGDDALAFSAMIYFEKNGQNWTTKLADSLEAGGGEKLAARLVSDKRIGSILTSGQSLSPGDTIWSPNLEYHLVYQNDGNLTLVKGIRENQGNNWWWSSNMVWDSKTAGTTPGSVTMQGDGGLVMSYMVGTTPTKKSLTEISNVQNGWKLMLQDDGNLVVSLNGVPKWDRFTGKL